MHLLFLLRHKSSSLSSVTLLSSTYIQSVSAFLTVVPVQRQRQQQFPRIYTSHSRLANVETKSVIKRQSTMRRCSSSHATASNNEIESKDNIALHQRPIFDEKHVQKVLFVECGMFCYILISDT
jgi:uncharacterized membrane protein